MSFLSFIKTSFLKLFKRLRPSKHQFLRVIGWYTTRVLAVALWCGVIWAILGDTALPRGLLTGRQQEKQDTAGHCVTVSPSAGDTELVDIFDYFNLSHSALYDTTSNSSTLLPIYSFVYSCNVTALVQYCLVTVQVNETCPTRVSLSVHLLNELAPPDVNYTIQNITFDIDIDNVLRTQLQPAAVYNPSITTQSLFDVPEGHFFALTILVIVSAVGGLVTRVMHLPPLLGMMIGGFLMRNIPVVGIAGDISSLWSSTLRNIALVIILLRGGLALDAKQLWKLKIAVPILALAPCITEGAATGLVAIYLLQIPWRWGLMLGFILSAISPAVVVPTTLSLGEKVKGINKGITTLIVAAANIDVVIAISLFSVFLGLIFSDGSIVLDAFRAPIEISVGVLYGIVCGLMLWILPTKLHTKSSKGRNHFFLLFGFGLFSLFGGRRAVVGGAALSGAGALGVLVVSFVAAQKWTSEEKKMVSRSFYLLWQFAQPILFGLIGAALNISDISGSLIGRAILLICIGLTLRLTVAVIAVTGNKFTVKEKVFVAISWIPKATVQAAIGSIALDLVLQSASPTDEDIQLGNTVLTIAVLAIVLCAPVGATLSSVLGPWLLKHDTDSGDNDNSKDAVDSSKDAVDLSKTDEGMIADCDSKSPDHIVTRSPRESIV